MVAFAEDPLNGIADLDRHVGRGEPKILGPDTDRAGGRGYAIAVIVVLIFRVFIAIFGIVIVIVPT